ncbi:MAG TPA: T9SS type A sorting domain-containing protein [Saprospiraceae bacterium]|nr:T9SS type A sorting domain-containing protein [Saprospiraceae bacterium]HMP12853.1 T9SS type A sorting domain-containing protein [Saprospiraceae bacterium]
MKKINILLLFILCVALSMQAQNRRYVDQVFTQVSVQTNIIYGVNATALALAQVGQAIPQPLTMDVYQPVGDTETARPVVLVFHTGNFLPFPQNGGTGGTKEDSTVVEVCTRLAKMGYVSAAVTYRLGWNPIAPNQSDRIFGIINAAYRGVQDARTAVRFLKRSVVEQSNPFGVDSTRVTLWGIGTGGYITLATASLDAYNKVLLPKFTTVIGGQPFPMVIEAINGDIFGTSVGMVPPGLPGYPFPAGDTLCYPNHVGYSSNFQLSVNMGGAMGDTLWMDAGQVPIMSFHVPTDPFAPYECAVLNVPPPINLPVVDVCGSSAVATKQNRLGNNSMWASANFTDAISVAMRARNNNREGLAPLPRVDPTDSSPWDFYAANNPNATTPPDPVRARLYIDTIMAYFAPRACVALNLDCNLSGISSTRNGLSANDVQLQMMPNPAYEQVRIQTSLEFPILDVQVFDMSGRMVKSAINLKDSSYTLQRGNLPNGMYIVKLRFERGIVTQKLVFN